MSPTQALKPTCITVHCSDTANGKKVDISEIRTWHLARGFSDVGYHLVIQPDGEIQPGRALNEIGAHVENHNSEGFGVNIGICLIGRDKFTEAQFIALRTRLDTLFLCFDTIPKWAIFCHNQWDTAQKQGKQCPNIQINKLLRWYFTGDEKAIAPHKI